MISFTCDYSEGAHPRILENLALTNLIQEPGYGFDSFSESARRKIREVCGCPKADVFFISGGTQANATVIGALLRPFEGVIAAPTGHIAVHESGAIEAGGHKVLCLADAAGGGIGATCAPAGQADAAVGGSNPSAQLGKISAQALDAYMQKFEGDESRDHMVQPAMVYISWPTEYGTLYSRKELIEIQAVCKAHGLKLFIDGARLGYGLASPAAEIDLPALAGLCDVFYIGGTKVGALCGEAVVFPKGDAPEHFFTSIKRQGALMAKGRLCGVQFDTLFTDNLYLDIARNAIERAEELKEVFRKRGIPFLLDSPTNQQFPILTDAQMAGLEGKVLFEKWEKLPDGRTVTRFATSWATTPEQIRQLDAVL